MTELSGMNREAWFVSLGETPEGGEAEGWEAEALYTGKRKQFTQNSNHCCTLLGSGTRSPTEAKTRSEAPY